jgi:hypothetical protein
MTTPRGVIGHPKDILSFPLHFVLSIIGHGIMAGSMLPKRCNLLKLLTADVRIDLKLNRIFESQNRFKIQVGGKMCHIP